MEREFISWDKIHKGTAADTKDTAEATENAETTGAADAAGSVDAAGSANEETSSDAAATADSPDAAADTYKDLPVDEDGIRQFITKDMLIGDVIEIYPSAAKALLSVGMHCVTCGVALYESVEEASYVHGLEPDDVIKYVNDVLTTELIEHPGETVIRKSAF